MDVVALAGAPHDQESPVGQVEVGPGAVVPDPLELLMAHRPQGVICYFSAVAKMDVGPALLIEYTAPAAVVAWLWLRRGQRPSRLTVTGAAINS